MKIYGTHRKWGGDKGIREVGGEVMKEVKVKRKKKKEFFD